MAVPSILVPSEISFWVMKNDVPNFPTLHAVLLPELLLGRFVPSQLVDGGMHYGL